MDRIKDPRFEQDLIKITNFSADFIGGKFNVYYPSPKNDNSIEFYFNRDIYDTFILFSKASGIGTATLTSRKLPVLVKEGNAFRNGMLKSEILVLNS